MNQRCVCCSRKGDQADMEPTYDWIHPSCLPRWHRRRELGTPLLSVIAGMDGEKAWRYAVVALVLLALLQGFAACFSRGSSADASLSEPPTEIWNNP